MRIRKVRGQRKTTCSKCNNPIEESRKGQRYCKNCHASYQRLKRCKHSDLTPEARKKANARSYVNVYIRRGKITKQPCEICGGKGEMHHDDYDKPLQVRWLCRKHHLEYHKNIDSKQQKAS